MSVLSRGETWDQRSHIATWMHEAMSIDLGSALWSKCSRQCMKFGSFWKFRMLTLPFDWENMVFVDTDCWNLLQEKWCVLSNGVLANCLRLSESQMSNHVQWILPLGEIRCESVYSDFLIKLLLYVLSSLTIKSFQGVRTQSRPASLLLPESF